MLFSTLDCLFYDQPWWKDDCEKLNQFNNVKYVDNAQLFTNYMLIKDNNTRWGWRTRMSIANSSTFKIVPDGYSKGYKAPRGYGTSSRNYHVTSLRL